MKKRMLYAALAAMTLATPAAAEPLRLAQMVEPGVEMGVLPPHEVVTMLRSTGLRPLDRPMLRGRNYVLHAVDRDGVEVRVVVNAIRGNIRRVVPVRSASRMPPRGGVTMGPYERMDPGAPPPPPGYIGPEPRRYGAVPPVADEDADMSDDVDAPRPPAGVPGAPPERYGNAAPPPVIRATPPGGPGISRSEMPPPSAPRVITADQSPMPDSNGLLPPPPERFPQRALPAPVRPKPMKRAAITPPKQAPLPKPRPSLNAAPAAPPATSTATPPPAPEQNPAEAPLPN